ncbi:hypothetical protein [Corynebacterium amycolatum]|uniref:hypothetical protein n=1 Tax=Corynebacterium amycolatum TaxID=43765 RepID=UPI00254ECE34|nr:hypothetical protein [Corynebacterium amycolatum]MDK7198918.1 hypothetical protein [Corynebacterium amycolatum]MDK7198925.1 hypothetical protein [Corynebacterium amycolatum]
MKFDASSLRIITTGEEASRPVFEYVDGKRSDVIKKDDAGHEMHRIMNLPAVWNGESVEVSLVLPREFTVPAYSILVAKNGTVEIGARADGNFAQLRYSVNAATVEAIGSYADMLRLK